MKSLKKVLIFSILSLINCSSVDYLEINKENEFEYIQLIEDETQIVFINKNSTREKMYIDLMFSHLSKYHATFNQYDEETKDNKNYAFYFNNEDIFMNLFSGLSSNYTENQTDLIEKEETVLGVNKICLKLTKDIKNIIVTIFRDDLDRNNNSESIKEGVAVRYKFTEGEKYNLKNNKVTYELDKDMLNITFNGISSLDEKANLINISVEYKVELFDKEELLSNFDNIYFYNYGKVTNLFSTLIKFEGDIIKKNNYLKIKAPLNDKKEQLLLIRAKVKDLNNNKEYLLQYQVEEFKVVEKSENKIWPPDESNDGGKVDTDEDNREKNIDIFYIIMGSFGGIVFLTFISFFIHFTLNKNHEEAEPEKSKDFEKIGQINPTD